ncbi:MAG: hypothetical protein B6I20_00605 [Bacteroidetes bacterium 4572_117]|nr:MAG: hypothetical protein B6I20_00605 [Bacteroidetes bacterium 4572_117]
MRRITFVFLLFAFATIVLAQNKQKKIALIIGNSNYHDKNAVLKNPVNDAKLIKTSLQNLGFEVTMISDATKTEIKRAVNNIVDKLSDCDIFVFYYSGHGYQIDGKNYLVPVDAVNVNDKIDADDKGVQLSYVFQKVESYSGGSNVFILDACRDNPFRSWTKGSSNKGFTIVKSNPTGSLIAFATEPNNVAFDGSGNNSPYTTAWVKQLKKPNLSIYEVLTNVRNDVYAKTGKKQQPWFNSSLSKVIYFNQDNTTNDSIKPNEPRGTQNYLTDNRDNKRYKTVELANQLWMAENLAYKTTNGSWSYDNRPTNVAKFGYLYNWETAKTVCPNGWRLPTKKDFETLLNNYGGKGNASYVKLMSGECSAFLNVFGGFRYILNGDFDGITSKSCFWTSSENNYFAWNLDVSRSGESVGIYSNAKSLGFSVRCIKGSTK